MDNRQTPPAEGPKESHAQLKRPRHIALRVLSCRLFYKVFSGSPSAIATRAVVKELDSWDVRPEAIAALQASKLARPTLSSLREFYTDHFQERSAELDIHLTLDEAASVSKLRSAVSRLAEDFAETRLRDLVATKKDGHASQSLEPSMPEKCRIMRALYFTEVFFNIFRQTSIPDAELRQCMNDFCLTFAHWEVEQIACVHDFLFLKVSPVFNDMASHDVFWGEFEVEPALWFGSLELQSILFKGLVTLESIAKAKTYSRQHELFDRGRIPATRTRNLYRTLKEVNYRVSNDQDASVSSFESSHGYAFKVKRPFFKDPDDGPFTIWKWAHKSGPLSRSVYHRNQATLRKGGYVMWDRARLDALGILRDEWQPRVVRGSLPDDPAGEVNDETWRFSRRERSRIYGEGGRGWWNFGDESKIVWTRDRKELAKTDNAPTSLDEARRAILALKRP